MKYKKIKLPKMDYSKPSSWDLAVDTLYEKYVRVDVKLSPWEQAIIRSVQRYASFVREHPKMWFGTFAFIGLFQATCDYKNEESKSIRKYIRHITLYGLLPYLGLSVALHPKIFPWLLLSGFSLTFVSQLFATGPSGVLLPIGWR